LAASRTLPQSILRKPTKAQDIALGVRLAKKLDRPMPRERL
jgi:hypothetical protein